MPGFFSVLVDGNTALMAGYRGENLTKNVDFPRKDCQKYPRSLVCILLAHYFDSSMQDKFIKYEHSDYSAVVD
jgi:hypothetical protein